MVVESPGVNNVPGTGVGRIQVMHNALIVVPAKIIHCSAIVEKTVFDRGSRSDRPRYRTLPRQHALDSSVVAGLTRHAACLAALASS